MRETQVTAKLVKALNAIPGCCARKRHGSAYTSGDPDVSVVYRGHAIFIEMKMLDGELSDLQAVMLERWQQAGATCVLGVWDPEQKAYAFFVGPKIWQDYVGKIKSRVINPINGEYTNSRDNGLADFLKGIHEATKKTADRSQ